MYNYKETVEKEKAALRKYRGDAIKTNKWPWVLLLFSLTIPAIIVVAPSSESFWCKLIKFAENFSLGLFTGLVVYVFVTFLPSTRKKAKAIDAIYFQLFIISELLDSIYYKFAPQNSYKDFRVFETMLYNFLVKDAHITDFNNKDQLHKTSIVNRAKYRYLIKMLSRIDTDIHKLITSYSQYIKNEDIATLLQLTQLKSDLAESLINNEEFDKDLLELFITNYCQLYCFQFPRVYREYEKYKSWEPMRDNS